MHTAGDSSSEIRRHNTPAEVGRSAEPTGAYSARSPCRVPVILSPLGAIVMPAPRRSLVRASQGGTLSHLRDGESQARHFVAAISESVMRAHAKRIYIMLDVLNAHRLKSFAAAYGEAEAPALEPFVNQSAPKHCSRLDPRDRAGCVTRAYGPRSDNDLFRAQVQHARLEQNRPTAHEEDQLAIHDCRCSPGLPISPRHSDVAP